MNDEDVDQKFDSIADAEISAEANRHLDRHIARTRDWLIMRESIGPPPTLHDLIQKVVNEPNKRQAVLVAYATALWRLIHQED